MVCFGLAAVHIVVVATARSDVAIARDAAINLNEEICNRKLKWLLHVEH